MNAPPTDLADGLGGRYRLERELGRGGMAVVWLAHDLKHDRPVALKVLHPDLAASLGPERFLREIKVAARLQHPHIVSVYDSGETAGRLWFTMPYVEGESLRDRLRGGPIPVAEALRIALQVAQALRFAHDHGVLHRDVKPENILLTGDGSPLVADFGIARPVGSENSQLTAAGFIVGTPSYMSPEQATGSDLDGRTDVYSLGCVLYEMLAGAPPFPGPTAQAVIGAHLAKDPPRLPTGRTGVPEPVRRVVARSLAKAPGDRYRGAGELAAALEEAIRQAGTRSAPARLATAVALAVAILALAYAVRRLVLVESAAAREESESIATGLNRTLSQLTSGEGAEEWPAWSPDGRRLAYVAEVNGYKQLFLRTLATGEERQLTRDTRDHIQPAWSPDATHLLFARAKAERGKLQPNDLDGWYHEGGEVGTLELASGRETVLVDDAFGASFSPDGRTLAFDAEWAGPRRIWIADARGRNPRQVTADSSDAIAHVQPRWSPDGTRLVFRRVEKTMSDIAVVPVGGQGMTRVTEDGVYDTDPIWSPDGRAVYFASSRGGGTNIWRVSVDDGGRAAGPPQQLTNGAGNDVQPAVAPDGRRLAFAVRGINADLWRLPVSLTARPTGEPQPVAASTRVESRGAWSPDGARLAFNSDRDGEMNLWVRSLADGTERRITSGAGGDYQPTWSPDGTRLVFFSARGGNTDVWSVAIDGGGLTRLTEDPGLDINPFLSPDGQWIAYMSDRSGRFEVWAMRADGSEERQVASGGVWGHFLRWTPDSRAVVFRSEGSSPTPLVRVDLTDGSTSRLPEVLSGGHISFSPDGSLALDVQGHKVIWAYPMTAGRPAYRVFEFSDPDVRIDYPVWSPDGRWIVFDRAAPREGDLWVLEGT